MADLTQWIRKGDRVRYRDCDGTWREGWAVSNIERPGKPPGQSRRHIFLGVYVSATPVPDAFGGMFWPIEDVALLSPTAGVAE